mmetsp:Transcript_17835/g.46702  ORF Transcript_17835/g.46702 Transcript_17835/m.46702 type:complete len:455 (-) Transcript_17835:67-1431(-)
MLDAHRKANKLRGDTGGVLLLRRHLRVGGRGRVDGEALGVADVGDVREEHEVVDERLAGLLAALDTKDDQRAALALDVLLLEGVHGVVGEAREADPLDHRVRLEVEGNLLRILAVTLHAPREGLNALEEHPRVVRRNATAKVAQRHGAHTEDVRERREHVREVLAPAQSTVARVRLVEERVLARPPVESTRVDDNAAHAGAVAARPLGEGRHDDVSAVLERLAEGRGGEGVVDDQWEADLVCLGRDLVEVSDDEGRVGDRLAEESAGLVISRLSEGLRVMHVDETNLDAHLGQDVVELGEGAAVKLRRAHDIVTRLRQVDDRVEGRVGARGHTEAAKEGPALEQGEALLEHVRGGVHEAGVDVAELGQREKARGLLGRAELVRRSAVDRHRARGRGGVASPSAVDAEALVLQFPVRSPAHLRGLGARGAGRRPQERIRARGEEGKRHDRRPHVI